MFASHTTKTLPIPFNPPHTVTIHKLSGRAIDAAQFAHMTGVATGRGRNWATTFVRRAAAGVATNADAEKVLADPLSGYDRLTLCKEGITSWTCEHQGKPVPVSPDTIDDLEDEALEWFATQVLQLTKPHLFQTDEERELARKNA